MRQQEEKEREEEKERLRKEKLYGKKPKQPLLESVQGAGDSNSSRGGSSEVESVKEEKTFNVSNEEAVRRLRRIGQPIRLFAESDKDRRLRLRALELIEERSEGQRNDFARAMEGQELGIEREKEKKKGAGEKQDKKDQAKKDKLEKELEKDKQDVESGKQVKEKEKKEPNPKDEEVLVDLNLVKTNPHKVYPQIYHALKVSLLLFTVQGCSARLIPCFGTNCAASIERMGTIISRSTRCVAVSVPQLRRKQQRLTTFFFAQNR